MSIQINKVRMAYHYSDNLGSPSFIWSKALHVTLQVFVLLPPHFRANILKY